MHVGTLDSAVGLMVLVAATAWPVPSASVTRFWVEVWGVAAAVWQLLVLTPLASDGRQIWRQLGVR